MARSARNVFSPPRRRLDQSGAPETDPDPNTVTLGKQPGEESPAPETPPAE